MRLLTSLAMFLGLSLPASAATFACTYPDGLARADEKAAQLLCDATASELGASLGRPIQRLENNSKLSAEFSLTITEITAARVGARLRHDDTTLPAMYLNVMDFPALPESALRRFARDIVRQLP